MKSSLFIHKVSLLKQTAQEGQQESNSATSRFRRLHSPGGEGGTLHPSSSSSSSSLHPSIAKRTKEEAASYSLHIGGLHRADAHLRQRFYMQQCPFSLI